MLKKKSKAGNKMSGNEMFRKLYPTQYQETQLFKIQFQHSERCRNFRKAWHIPKEGFASWKGYYPWYHKLVQQTNSYLKSNKYKRLQKKLAARRKEWQKNKITENDLRFFGFRIALTVPLHKYDFDLDQIALRSGKPLYWRYFIEQCLLLDNPEVSPITRSLPEPKLRWDSESQSYELIVQNLYPDTIIKDFSDPRFTHKFKEFQKKLSGYQAKKPRIKKRMDFGLQILDLDATTKMSDSEKAEELEGEIGSLDFGLLEKRRLNRLKQVRHRLKKYLKGGGDT